MTNDRPTPCDAPPPPVRRTAPVRARAPAPVLAPAPALATIALATIALAALAAHARPTPAAATPGTTVTLPPDRRVDWSRAGIPGGIPIRDAVCATVDAARFGDGRTDATEAIQAALDGCPPGQVVVLPPGTYATSATIHLRTDKTLRGAGQGRTIVRFAGPRTRAVLDMRGAIYNDVFNLARTYAIPGGARKDDTALTLDRTADIAVGDVVLVDIRNDGELVDHVGSEGPCTYCSRADGTRARGQLVEVVAVDATRNVVGLNLPLFFDLDAARQPEAVLVSARSLVRRAGVEGLTLTQAEPVNDFIVEMDGSQQCWLKDVEITGMRRRGIWHIESLQNEIRDSTFHGAAAGYGRDRGYGLQLDLQSTANLVENNVVYDVDGGGIMTSGGAVGNVIAYNHLPDIRFDDPWWLIGGPSINHSPHPSMNLWEGNIGPQISGDFIHGSSSHQVSFRCRSAGWKEETATSNNNAVDLAHKNRYMTVIGCVLGTPGRSNRYEVAYPTQGPSSLLPIWRLGYGGPNGTGDPQVRSTLLRHGNWDSVTGGVAWDPAIPERDLPPSLYRTTKPPWWGDLPWPAIGPDVDPIVGRIPAQLRFEARPGAGATTTPWPSGLARPSVTGTATGMAIATASGTATATATPPATAAPSGERYLARLPIALCGVSVP